MWRAPYFKALIVVLLISSGIPHVFFHGLPELTFPELHDDIQPKHSEI